MPSVNSSRVRRTLAGLVAGVAGLAAAGVGAPASAIVGGVEVPRSDYPFVGRLTSFAPSCSGTLIAENTLLAAASCSTNYALPFQFWDIGGLYREVKSITVHPLWNGDPTAGHDLAIVRLKGSTAGIPTIQVGAPWQPQLLAPGTPSTMVSLAPRVDPDPRGRMWTATTPLRSDADMADVLSNWPHPISWNAPMMLGAGLSGRTACADDRGSPLLVQQPDGWTQVGVASLPAPSGVNCADAAGYAELTGAQLAWVASQVPSIIPGWGPCDTQQGGPKQSWVRYLPVQAPGTTPDGPYWWDITCSVNPPPPPPPPPPPEEEPPEEEPPDPPICRLPPWKCPDL